MRSYKEMKIANPSQKRIAIFLSSVQGGGAQRAMLKLARGITERGFDVDLVLAEAKGVLLSEVPRAVRVIDLESPRVLWSIPALAQYLRREPPQAMLSVLNYVNIVALWSRQLARVTTRLVISERNTLSQETRNARSRRGKLMPRLAKLFYPWADGIAAVSDGVGKDLSQVTGIPYEKIQVIYNPIITPEFERKSQVPLDHPWFEAGQPPVVLAVGRLGPQKDFPTLIRAFARLRRNRATRLLILGEGRDRADLEELIRQLKLERDVFLPGFIENPYPYMSHCSLFVLSSRWEGLPGVLIEALYCRATIVSTDCPSGPREILRGGQYGQLVPVGDASALADAMELSLSSRTPPPPAESWQPFELETVVNQYLRALLIG